MLETIVKKMRPQADPSQDRSECGSVPCTMTDGILGDLLPDLDKDISQLLHSLCWDMVVEDVALHDVPEVLDWI